MKMDGLALPAVFSDAEHGDHRMVALLPVLVRSFYPEFQAKPNRKLSHIRYAAALIHQLIKTANM